MADNTKEEDVMEIAISQMRIDQETITNNVSSRFQYITQYQSFKPSQGEQGFNVII
jgi:hypothetical protein